MNIKILELSEKYGKFIVYGTDASFANGIRRTMISEVPKLAIEYIKIYDNTSILYDEQIGLRLALVPIIMDSNYIEQSKCNCNFEGCFNCELSMRLDAKGPKIVYSRDIISSDQKSHIADPNIPIIELKEGQVLILEALAHVGFGKDHVRWQAGVACGYKNMPIINIKECDACGSCVSLCPKKIIKIENNKASILYEDMINCSLCKICEKNCDLKEPAITVNYDPSIFIFNLESDGSYNLYDLILKSVDVLNKKFAELNECIDSIYI